MSDPMWAGGPQQFQDRYPYTWATFPDFMRDQFYPVVPPKTTLSMSLICAGMMVVPIIGPLAAKDLGEYQSYYAAQFAANPPGSSDGTVPTITIPEAWSPPITVEQTNGPDMAGMAYDIAAIARYIGFYPSNNSVHLQLDAIESAIGGLPGSGTISSKHDIARILAAIYYTAAQPIAITNQYDDSAVLSALAAARTSLEGGHTSLAGSLVALASDLISHDTQMDTDHGAILEAIGNIPTTGGAGASGYPGSDLVTLSSPSSFSGPSLIEATMDGLLLDLTEMAPSTGYQTHAGYHNWLHAGWLAFLTDGGYADEMQYLNLNQRVYVPKQCTHAHGVLLYPRAGTSGTITPYTLTS